ncbi:MAG: signal transduction histidine kinase [Bacteroidetes bacterium OLB10]|nr:MAG: signal transduction histidine kinase [Bacteroidetes bacterium OLB10]
MIFRKTIALTIGLLFLCAGLIAQNDFHVYNYTTKNGLPENNLIKIFLAKDGFLWIAYSNGLLRFDGNNFRKINTSETPFPNVFINQTLTGEKYFMDASGYIIHFDNNVVDTIREGNDNALNYLNIKGVLPDIKTYIELTTPHVNETVDKEWDLNPLTMFPVNRQRIYSQNQ